MSYCTKCGREVEAGVAMCPYCGNDISGANMEYSGGTVIPKKFNLFTAYAEMFKRYADFSGRSTRSEYWYVYLVQAILGFIAVAAAFGFGTLSHMNYRGGFEAITAILYLIFIVYCLVTAIPFIALSVRRLHDTGKSGWFYLLGFIPSVGEIIIIVLMAMDSEKGRNKYGPNPKGE